MVRTLGRSRDAQSCARKVLHSGTCKRRPMKSKASSAVSRSTILDFLFGRPLASDEERTQRVGPVTGVAIFGLDALSSAAYGPEAALTILGAAGARYIVPISLSIIVLLTIVYFSY